MRPVKTSSYDWFVFRFNPRICKRCDSDSVNSAFKKLGFNPRICKRCDLGYFAGYDTNAVSIHASVKDATSILPTDLIICSVSIHASVKDATYDCKMQLLSYCFNPRICKRCDLINDARSWIIIVSIHASVKDATKIPVSPIN